MLPQRVSLAKATSTREPKARVQQAKGSPRVTAKKATAERKNRVAQRAKGNTKAGTKVALRDKEARKR